VEGQGRISRRGSASAPRRSRSVHPPLDAAMLGYIDPHTVCLRLACFTLRAFIAPYYLGISDYLLGRRRDAANSHTTCAIFYTLADLIVF
jgi:hypothetical protein